ncbi:MAG TPA: glycoside hydrolase family 20 zincin-like fold domain-containing protein [Candidatus Brocadiia bacterium]|nr:glycoside hydrolase family 20 zincin-like fold domain-containing protein [Candidatus Brocadiia bacterium]
MRYRCLSHSLFLVLAAVPFALAAPLPDLVPMPKQYQALEGAVDLTGLPLFIPLQNRQCVIAAEELALRARELGGQMGAAAEVGGTASPGVYVLPVDHPSAAKLAAESGLKVTASSPGRQGYVLRAGAGRVVIIGSDNVGALYGAMTLRQMMQGKDGAVQAPAALITDWPDFGLRVSLSEWRGLRKLAAGEKSFIPGAKAGIDWMLRYKMNIIEDYYGQDARAVPQTTRDYYREINAYAVDRGIYPLFMTETSVYGWHGSKTGPVAPPGVKEPKDWPCIYDARPYRESYYCWSDDAAAKAKIEAMADFLKECNFKVIYNHCVDGGSLPDPEMWSRRCPRCRQLWKDDERWKATVHQWKLWSEGLLAKNPDLKILAIIYPYHAGYLNLRTPENEALWKQNVWDYWTNIHREMPKSLYFCTWIADQDANAKFLQILKGRPVEFSDCYAHDVGVFGTQSRFYNAAAGGDPRDMVHVTGGNLLQTKWMVYLNSAEFAWNAKAPGAEPYTMGMLFYDIERDNTGPAVIMNEWLPRACRSFWGADIAPQMARFYSSGLQPRYILDPAATISRANQQRADPMADTDPASKKRIATGKVPPVIVDDAARMKRQADIARACAAALDEAYDGAAKLDRYKMKLFAKYYRRVHYWLAVAQARYDMRVGDELVAQGRTKEAAKLYRDGIAVYEQNMAEAEKRMERVKTIPDPDFHTRKQFAEENTAKALKSEFSRKAESAETILQPRRPGRFVRVAVFKGLGAQGTLDFLNGFANVKAEMINDIGLKTLDRFDCVFMLRNGADNRFDYFQNLRRYVVEGGGGVVIEHTHCGHKRFETRTPFPEVCQRSVNRWDNFDRNIYTVSNPLLQGVKPGAAFQNMYIDFFEPVPGKDGFVVAVDKDKHPAAVAGKVGLGKVVFNGGVSVSSVNNTYDAEEKEIYGFNALIAEKAVEWFTGVRLEKKEAGK